jgi:pimeloyl-ACP methyl ester carboxylesterase
LNQSGFAPVEGTALYYEIAGDGPPVVLLHPGQAGQVLWDRQFLPFARAHRVLRFDARGFGRSELPDIAFSFHEDLRGLLDYLHVDRPSLVGLSLGGRTAIDFALVHPDRVASLVLVNAGISGYTFSLDDYSREINDAVERNDRAAYVESSLRQWFDGPGQPTSRTPPALREEVKRIMREQTELAARRATRPRLTEVGALERLQEITAPTLIVESALDAPDIHTIAALLQRDIRGSRRVVIDNAAHLVNVERPDEFARVVLDFLGSVARSA